MLARLGLGSVLRRLAESRSPVLLALADGAQVRGGVGRIGADFVEVLVERPDPGSRGPAGADVVPLAAVAAAARRVRRIRRRADSSSETWPARRCCSRCSWVWSYIRWMNASSSVDLDPPLTAAAQLDGAQLLALDERRDLGQGGVEDLGDVGEREEPGAGHAASVPRTAES